MQGVGSRLFGCNCMPAFGTGALLGVKKVRLSGADI